MITFRSPWFPFFAALVVFLRATQGVFHLDDYAILVDPAITSPNGWLDCFRWTPNPPLDVAFLLGQLSNVRRMGRELSCP